MKAGPLSMVILPRTATSTRSLFFFFFWFLWTGGANILPQLYFIHEDPEYKEAWVSLLLMLGSVISVCGVWLAGRLPYSLKALKVKLFVFYFIVVTMFSVLFFRISLPLYYLCYLLFRFFSCYTYQRLDYLMIHGGHPEKDALTHARISIVFMLLGITIAPLFFAYFHAAEKALPWIILLAAIAYRTSGQVGRVNPSETPKSKPAGLKKADRQFIIYSLAYLAVVFLSTTLLVYFARDHYGMDGAAVKAGWVMMVSSGAAFLSALVYGVYRKNIPNDIRSPFIQSIILGLWVTASVLIYLKLHNSLGYLCFCGILMGISYGVYMVLGRQFVSIRDRTHKNGMITLFNMLPYYATILIFGIAGLLKLASKTANWDYYAIILVLLLSLLSVSASQTILMMTRRGEFLSGLKTKPQTDVFRHQSGLPRRNPAKPDMSGHVAGP